MGVSLVKDGAPGGAAKEATAEPSAWLRMLRPGRDAVGRVVCFPHAGGTASAFTPFGKTLPDDLDVLAVQYPGRQTRRAEPFAETAAEIAAGVAEALGRYTDRPLFFLGNSMGAIVGFETARLLAGTGAVRRLFAAAAMPPADDWHDRDLSEAPEAELVDEMRRLGGVPEPLIQDPDMLREILRPLRADHRVLGGYRCEPGTRLAIPITVLVGAEDPKNGEAAMAGWSRHTSAAQDLEVLPGGHFALLEQAPLASGLLESRIRGDLARSDEKSATASQPVAAPASAVPAVSAAPAPASGDLAAPVPAPGDLVRRIYLAGLKDQTPQWPTDLSTLQEAALKVLTPQARAYIVGDAGTGATGRANSAAFDGWRLVPRVLRDASVRDLSVSLFGRRLPFPVLLAPIAAQTLAHPDGELATARAAAAAGIPFVLSSLSSHPLEQVAGASGTGHRWFQFYWPADPALADSMVGRAEAAGYTALVLTVDTSALSYRPSDLDTGRLPFLTGVGIANYTSDPVFRASLPSADDRAAAVARWAQVSTNPRLTWDDLDWLRRRTTLPILVKGILHADDARRAVELGMDGVIVSNHGGRQLDGAVAALDALPAVRAAVGPEVPVLMDSGIRTGPDVVKALALGANAVLYGRPYLYGLALGGQSGAEHVIECLLADVDLTLALSGSRSVAEIGSDLVLRTGVGQA